MREGLNPSDLRRKRYYWSPQSRQPETLHEDRECLTEVCRARMCEEMTLAEARGLAREVRVRLCLRCGSLK